MTDRLRAPRRKMTVEEFFDWQLEQDINYELVDGVPVPLVKATTGASDRHDALTVNAIGALFPQLRGKPCRPRTQDRAIRTYSGIRRPDLLIERGNPEPRSMEAVEPRVVFEVLSPSTARYDRFQKLAEYQAHGTIRAIVLVDTEAPRLTVRRREDGAWKPHELSGLDALLELPEIEARLPLAELYVDLAFDDG